MRFRKPGPFVLALVLVTTLSAGSSALAQPIPVETSVVSGTRTLTLKSLVGDELTGVSMGTTGTAGFVANVTDLQYSRAGYQVTAALSNLYLHDGAGYDCSKTLGALNFSLDFLVDPVTVADVEAIAEAVWDLTGSLPGDLALLLGVAGGTVVDVTGLDGEQLGRDLAGVLQGVEDSLPIKVAPGTGGAFENPGPHADCDPTPSSTTTLSLQNGTDSDLSDLFTWVGSEITAAADPDSNGVISATELVDSGEVNADAMAEAVRQALSDAGVNLGLLDSLIDAGTLSITDIYDVLEATLEPVTALLGQTGTYLSLPKLNVSVPAGTSAGTYRGTLTVTLVDV